jgi:hypothetical protein
MEAILGDDASKALKNYSVIFEKLLRLRQGLINSITCSFSSCSKPTHVLFLTVI